MRFASAKLAYEWAMEILSIRRGGRAIQYDPDAIGQRGVPKDYALLDAITILSLAERHDIVNGRGSYFTLWYMPSPTEPRPEWTSLEMERVVRAAREFEHELCKLRFVDRCARPRCVRGRR